MQITVFLHVNDVKIYQFKAKHLEIKPLSLCNIQYPLGNISKDFKVDNTKKWIEWKGERFFC